MCPSLSHAVRPSIWVLCEICGSTLTLSNPLTADYAEYAEAEKPGKGIPFRFPRGLRVPRLKWLGHSSRRELPGQAAGGLRFERFYAGAPVCSPTRATVLTGRSNDRAGVLDHGYALRRQEKTIARALRDAGYATAHFGKWHLNGIRGPGVPVLAKDDRHPGHFGFDGWLSVTNYFDRNPILGRPEGFAEFTGDSSDIIVAEALKFIARIRAAGKPSFTVIWYGSPHHPASAADADKAAFAPLDRTAQNHYGELVALDRSIGTLRQGLREMGLARNTLVWFCSDNGGLKDITPGTVGGLRDFKGSLYEGGLRVPAIIEWPAAIRTPRITRYPAGIVDPADLKKPRGWTAIPEYQPHLERLLRRPEYRRTAEQMKQP